MGSLKTSTLSTVKRVGRLLFVSTALVTLTACSALDLKAPNFKNISLGSIKAPWGNNDPAYDLIAANLVNSMVQIPLLNPLITPVQMAEPKSEYETQLQAAMTNRGFQIEPLNDESEAFRVNADIDRAVSSSGKHKNYSLSIGPITVARGYRVISGDTVPVTPQHISGTNERAITINDDLFKDSDITLAAAEFEPLENPERVTIIAVPIEKAEPKLLAANANTGPTKNLFETGQSNYVEVFDGYEDVEQSVLIFPNDSLRLGDNNKQIIEQYVSKMDPDTDVLSVIGCSIGQTDIKNGNSLLALGRANRVKEAFLFSGLEHEQILEEGCWAPEAYGEALPRRGVVVTLKRQKAS